MVRASDIVSVLLRIGELICACIVTGLLGTFFHYLSDAHAHASSRLIFLMSIAGISIVATFALSPPVKYTFWAFPFDFIMFVLWMVAFGLIVDLTGTAGCNSSWYWHTWGWYWGRWYRIPGTLPSQALVGTAGCAQWRAMLAFTFSGGCIWFTSGCLVKWPFQWFPTTLTTLAGSLSNHKTCRRPED